MSTTRTTLDAAIRYERVRLRSLRGALVVTVLGLACSTAIGVGFAWEPGTGPAAPGLVVNAITGVAEVFGIPPLALLCALVAAHAVLDEFRHGTATTTFVLFPRRGVALAAKLLVTGTWTAALATTTTLVVVLVGSAMPGPDVLATALDADVLIASVGYVLTCTCWALMAGALACLMRGLGATLAVLLGVPFVLEPVLALVALSAGWLAPWLVLLPGAAGRATYATVFTDLPVWQGMLALLAQTVVLVVVGTLALRRDV